MADLPDDSNPFAIGRNVVGSSTPSGGAQESAPEAVDTQNPFDIGRNVKRLATNEFLQDSVSKQRDWGEVESFLKDRGYNPAPLKTSYALQQARVKAAQPQEKGLIEKAVDVVGAPFGYQTTAGPETTLQKFKREYMPFADALGTNGNTAYSAATAKLKAGDASKEDLDTIARYEELQKLDEKVSQSFEGKLVHGIGKISQIVGEAGLGGALVQAGKARAGIGYAKAVIDGKNVMVPVKAATRLGRIAEFAGTQAATLPLTPSLFVPMAQQNNLAQGRAANDWRGYPTAVGYGYANLLVLGQLQGGVETGNIVSQALKKGALGTAELSGVDVAAGLADEFLPKAFETNTRYGTIGQLARGSGLNLGGKANPNDLRQGLEHTAVTVLTFSALAAMHGRPKEAAEVPKAFAADLKTLDAAGLSPEAVAAETRRVIDPVTKILETPDITREEAIQQVGEAYNTNKTVRALVDSLPPMGPATAAYEANRKAGLSPEDAFAKATQNPDEVQDTPRRPGFLSADRIEVAPLKPGQLAPGEGGGLPPGARPLQGKRVETFQQPEVENNGEVYLDLATGTFKNMNFSASRPAKPVETFQPPERSETNPAESNRIDSAVGSGPKVTATRSPIEVLGEAQIRALGKQFGIHSGGPIEKVLERIQKSPTSANSLDLLVKKRLAESEKPTEVPTAPQNAPEAPKTVEAPVSPVRPQGVVLKPGTPGGATRRGFTIGGEKIARHEYTDSEGKTLGHADVINSGDTLKVDWIGQEGASVSEAGDFARSLGAGNVRSLLRQLADQYPNARYVEGLRTTGARTGKDKVDQRTKVQLPGRGEQKRRAEDNPERVVSEEGKSAAWHETFKAMEPLVGADTARKIADKDHPSEPAKPVETFQQPGVAPSRIERMRAAQAGRETAVPKAAAPVLSREEWHRHAELSMQDAGIPARTAAAFFEVMRGIEAKEGWVKAREWFEQRVGSKIKAMAANDAADERKYEQTPYTKITPARRAKLDPLIDRLSRESGLTRQEYEAKARAAQASGGREAVDNLIELWRDKVNRYDPTPEEHAANLAELEVEQKELFDDFGEPAGPDSGERTADTLVEREAAKRVVQQVDADTGAQAEGRPRARQSRQERVPTPEPRAPEEPRPQAPAGQTGEAGVEPPVETFQSPQEKIDALYKAGSPDLKQALEGAMFNHTPEAEGGKPYDLADSIAAEWRGALEMGKPDLAAELAPAVRAAGGSFYGTEPGKKADYSGKYYESVKGIGAGDRVEVVRQPVVHVPTEKVLVKGQVRPVDRLAGAKAKAALAGPVERKQRAGESDWLAQENGLREQGVVTLGQEVRTQYGGIDPADFKKSFGEGEYQNAVDNFGKSMFTDKDGGAGTGKVEDIVAQLADAGHIPEGTDPYKLLELIGQHRPVEGLGGAERDLQRHQLDEARADAETKIRKENPNLSDAEVEKRIQQSLKDQLEGRGGYKPSEESIPFHTPKGETFQSGEPGKPAKALTPFELSATIDHLLDVTNYTEKVTPYGNPAAVAILKAGEAQPQAIVTQKMFAAEPSVRLEEAGHVLAARYGLELAPAALPGNVAQGFLEFWGKPGRAPSRLSTLEGFSQWLIDRTAGRLDPQTPAQKEAAAYAEAFVKKNGLDKPIAQLEPLYRAWEQLPPIEKAAKLLSGNGLQASAQLSPQQKAKLASDSIQERFQDDIETNLGPLYRIESQLEKRLGRKLEPGERPSTVYSQLMHKERPLAGEMLRDGVKTIQDGKWITIGQSEAKILEGSKPEWLTPIFDGGPSKFDLWTVARHLEGEFGRGEKPVPDATRADYKAAYDELAKDAEFVAWADPAAERLTRAFLNTRLALEGNGIHALPEGTAETLHKKRPDYVPLDRVLTDKGWNVSTGNRGERNRAILTARSGSGEQIVSPLVSYRKRLLVTASVMTEQMKFNALEKLAKQPGMGDYLLAGEAKLSDVGAEEFKRVTDRLAELGIEGADVSAILKDLGLQNGQAMFSTKPWESDPTKNTKWGIGADGKPTNYRIADRALYELVTDQQVQAHQLAKIVNGIANFSIGGVRPIKAMGDLVKLGATSVNLAFHLRNIPRDAFAFWTNTIDRATVGQLPNALKRAFAFEFGVLKAGLRGETFQSADRLFQLFHDARGDQLRQFAFESKNPLGASETFQSAPASKVTKAIHGTAGFLKDALNFMGAGELGPRFLEFKTRLKQLTGLDEAGLVSKLDAAEKAAAEGKDYVQPFDYEKILDAMDAAAEVTVPFGRQGVLTRELNKIQPYFGPAIAGASKAIRNIKDNPKGALMGLATIAGLRLLHWATFKDEQWYEELSATDRYRNFVVPTPWGLRRVPAPRGLEVPVGGFLLPMLDKAAGKKPDVRGLVTSTIDDLAPPLPITPIGHVAVDVATNKNWRGTPIVPGRDEHLSATDKALQYQLPYAAEQLSGGRANLSFRGAGVVPFTEVKNARRSVDEFYETFQELETARLQAKNRGEKFTEEARLLRFEHAKKQIEDISRQIRGGRVVGGRVVAGEAPSEDRQKELRERQLQIARNLLSSSRGK